MLPHINMKKDNELRMKMAENETIINDLYGKQERLDNIHQKLKEIDLQKQINELKQEIEAQEKLCNDITKQNEMIDKKMEEFAKNLKKLQKLQDEIEKNTLKMKK